MNLRGRLKHLIFGSCPGFKGWFRYFGHRVNFPPSSMLFARVCDEGVFERSNVQVLGQLVRPGTWFFDVGANIGLISIPVLAVCPASTVVSFEPSPNALPFLRRTREAGCAADRWHLVPKAAAREAGTAAFSMSAPSESIFDGLNFTGRVPKAGEVLVETTTLDAEWERFGRPPVSAIKIDVEGAELDVLRGATRLLRDIRPAVLLEWSSRNLAASGVPSEALTSFASESNYSLYAMPGLTPIPNARLLLLHMAFGESFLLLPSEIPAN